MKVGACNPNTQNLEAENYEFKIILNLHSKFETQSHKMFTDVCVCQILESNWVF